MIRLLRSLFARRLPRRDGPVVRILITYQNNWRV